LEHKVKEAKADALCASAECAKLKMALADFQDKTNEALEMILANNYELIAGLDCWDDIVKHDFTVCDGCLDCLTKELSEESNRVSELAFLF
jgi:hypothetical protein